MCLWIEKNCHASNFYTLFKFKKKTNSSENQNKETIKTTKVLKNYNYFIKNKKQTI